MKMRSALMLGLAFDDRSVHCAEVSVQGPRRTTRKLGRFIFADGVSIVEPAALGAALRTFLQSHGFTASHAVIGVPAKWLIAQERDVPPSDVESALAVLRMHGERMALAGGSEMVIDVAGGVTRTTSRALLVGILKQQLDRLRSVADAAGLELRAVTSTSLASHQVIAAAGDASLLVLSASGAEVVSGQGGGYRLLRHVSTGDASTLAGRTQLTSELRRTVTLSGLNTGGPAGPIMLWNGVGLNADEVRELSQRAGINVAGAGDVARMGETPVEALNGSAAGTTVDAFYPAVAVAIAGAAARELPVNFTRSRLAPPPVRRFGRRSVRAVAIVAVAAAAMTGMYYVVQQREAEALEIGAKLTQMEPDIKAADAMIDRVVYGRSYFENRPPILEGLAEVTRAFRYNEPVWATSFSLRDNRKGVLQGKAANQALAIALLDRLKASPRLREVQLVDLREAGGRSTDQTFSISFVYTGTD
jgi:hypothetical protein